MRHAVDSVRWAGAGDAGATGAGAEKAQHCRRQRKSQPQHRERVFGCGSHRVARWSGHDVTLQARSRLGLPHGRVGAHRAAPRW